MRAAGGDDRRLSTLILIALAVAGAVLAAAQTSPWRLVDLKIFDYFSTLAPPSPSADAPIIVAIDEPSMAEVGLRWPWPRDLHADLVRSLRAAGAKAIGLDIIFSEPSAATADQALADALAPDVVLAADLTVIRTPQADQQIRVEPLPAFTEKRAGSGLASVAIESDGVVRKIPIYEDGFAARVLEAAGRPAPAAPADALIQTFGPARTFETVSYYQALDPAAFLPEGIFRDRIVLVGLSTQSASQIDAGGPDLFAISFTSRSRLLLPGVELQATILENLAENRFIMPVPTLAVAASVMLAAALAVATVRWQTGWRTAAAAVATVLLCFGGGFLLVRYGRIFLPPLAPSLAFAAVAGIQSARDYADERRRRMRITRAFSQYLSPVLVQRLADDPSPLKLGGERRVITVLFCDVRGFTTISEQMKDDPEGLTSLMNRLLNPLSEVILEAGGTIDKYIGDAVMAFWNAPLEDPDHARHAVEAALGTVQAIDKLNAELEAEAGATPAPRLRIGVGVNTGECVVGNMGSDFRFNYSALGDPVNLAARLESGTKALGVSILIGEETARRVADQIPLAPLDRITVKGKREPVTVSTPVPGCDLQALAIHGSLVADLLEERLANGDSRFALLRRDLPPLAEYYRLTQMRLKARAD
ncbi:adenylate/guanylate cyclase domain-containing protein [Pseudaminobacter sp. 19-2017]|uniref:Adenylate/guanylate cyclase domain-containing protein n=1 Tax=Pseudaminobacter soli (ex Zhang et al. 2022) TaxID=2831468 RepID=A0A942E1N2_9HYPH|nr:adenylate/guanylate cyclase domain-containing protein [Pseudaminobacter soli]MBS3648960.1 adenylate/guanylate cyclase domain-containing protein [Pseudaminobacter soli]